MSGASILADDPVTRFLVLCLRARFDEGALDEARAWALREALDWTQVDRRAAEEALTPLLFSLLREQNWPPSDLLERWHRAYMHAAMRNTLRLAELAHIIQALRDIKISVIVLKGAALAKRIYGNVALRPMVDIDLLVHREDLPAAIRAIKGLGYAPHHTEEHPGMFLAYENEVAFHRPDQKGSLLELHWSLIDSPAYQDRLPMAWFWRTASPETFGDAPALILGPEAMLLHLSAHLMLHHQGMGLRWLHDMAEVVQHHSASLDWELLLDRARRYDLLLPLQATLPLVARRWRVSVPGDVLARLTALTPSAREQRIFQQMTTPEAPVARRFWHDLLAISGWRRRLQFLGRKLFPSTRYMRQRYQISSVWLTPFFYPYRWWLGMLSFFHKDTRGDHDGDAKHRSEGGSGGKHIDAATRL
jgi:hypothetical protein